MIDASTASLLCGASKQSAIKCLHAVSEQSRRLPYTWNGEQLLELQT